jgi:preprotein translocase subunit SecD
LRQNLLTWLIGIVIVAVLAGYVDFSDRIGFGDFTRDTHLRKGLDLEGGLQLVLQAEPRRAGDSITPDQLNAARRIIEDRANGTGANEPVVQTAEGNRILVELPGIQNLEDATKVIQGTAFLEIVDGGSDPPAADTFITTTLGPPRPEQLRVQSNTENTNAVTNVSPTATSSTAVTTTTGLSASGTVTATGTVSGTGGTVATPAPTPQAEATAPVSQPDKVFTTIISGDDIDGSKVSVGFDPANRPLVLFGLQGNGPKAFADFTASHVGQFMPIVLDKKVISAPTINGPIPNGSGQIEGMSLAEAQRLALQLKYGALPVSLRPLESRKIAATLGQEAVDKSLIAGAVGLGLVVLFMIVYYRVPGVLASVALLIYSAIAYAVFKLVPVTMTLAGFAGFILSIGMAVDANVLIFARLKDELRSGKTLAAAVEAGFDHAWPSIRDSNMSTLITCAILFWFGSTFGGASIIKGFALTLAIGVIVSLFTAVTVSRTFLRAVVPTALSRNRWAFFLEGVKRSPSAAPAPATPTDG